VRAQRSAKPLIGYLQSGSFEAFGHIVPAFREGLKDAGYVEGQNVAIEYRWADGHYDRLQALAADLVSRQAAVIAAAGGTPAAVAAKAATSILCQRAPVAMQHPPSALRAMGVEHGYHVGNC
jgi:putative tryptophan/tyrosine transport system substrate-binding protein